MALWLEDNKCKYCGEFISKRRYASGNWDNSSTTVDLWVVGNGKFPGDQRFCESHIIDTDGSIGDHEPMTDATFTEFANSVIQSKVPTAQRKGQFAFNQLSIIRPGLASTIINDERLQRDVDPFYNDDNLPSFWVWVNDNW